MTLTKSICVFSLLAMPALLAAQSTEGGWRRADEPAPNQTQAENQAPPQARPQVDRPSSYPAENGDSAGLDQYGAPRGRASRSDRPDRPSYAERGAPASPPAALPAQLTIKPGTYVTIRVNNTLSSDYNHAGDAFTATLARPIVVDGVVVAQRGQTVGGRVAEAEKAGRVKGTSRLAIQLIDLTLADGNQVPIQSQLIGHDGGTSVGRDAAAIGTTTAAGAAIGAAAGWGTGAAIGAGAGAVASTIGVLLTRGHPTIIDPETVLTFRLESPVTVATDRAPEAFRTVSPQDYDRPQQLQSRRYVTSGPPAYYAPYPYYYYPYWGPSFGFGYGYGWGYRGYYGRGFRRW